MQSLPFSICNCQSNGRGATPSPDAIGPRRIARPPHFFFLINYSSFISAPPPPPSYVAVPPSLPPRRPATRRGATDGPAASLTCPWSPAGEGPSAAGRCWPLATTTVTILTRSATFRPDRRDTTTRNRNGLFFRPRVLKKKKKTPVTDGFTTSACRRII